MKQARFNEHCFVERERERQRKRERETGGVFS